MYTPTARFIESKATTRLVGQANIDRDWPELEPLIESALKDSRHELVAEDVRIALIKGEMFVFVTERDSAIELACVVEVWHAPRYKLVHIVALAGRNLRVAAMFLPALEQWALAMGAVEIRGWAANPAIPRLYRRLGLPFVPAYQVLVHDLRRKLQ